MNIIHNPVFPKDCLQDSQKKLEQIIKTSEDEINELLTQKILTYHNFIRPFMEIGYEINNFFGSISHLQGVKNSPESQEAFSSCIGILTDYSTKIAHNKKIYNAFIAIKANEYQILNGAQKKVLDDEIFGFELEGVALDDSSKERIKTINIRLGELADNFSQNVLDATNAYSLIITDESVLGEMPESDKTVAKKETGWEFTLQMPSYLAFMTYAADRNKREEIYKAYSSRAPENSNLIEEILQLKSEKAKILGFDCYADLKNKTMAAPTVDAVIDFLHSLGSAGRAHALNDKNALMEYASIDGVKGLAAYDTAYYSEKLKKEKYDYNEEELRPYFEQNNVVKGLFSFLKEMFELDFQEKKMTLWDPKAKYYEASINGRKLGGLFFDLESRKDKRGGAWMNDWHSFHKDENDDLHLPDIFVVCNFPESMANTPSLLRHNDVSTLFHEMGHALHHLLSGVEELAVSGVNGIDWDTVEFPSQFLENFAYSNEVLQQISSHWETGDKIPQILIDKVVAARNFQAGMQLARQLEFGLFDMLIHKKLMNASEVQKTLDTIRQEFGVIIPPSYNKFQHGFSHIFAGGYAAGYYSYKWAEMLSSDAYLEFVQIGILNKELAHKYRDTVLTLGASKKMSEIYDAFLGRQPEAKAILLLAGLN